MPRLLVVSHGHPDLSPGGAEHASYGLHAMVRAGRLAGWTSTYAARAEPRDIGHDGDFGLFRGRRDEVIVHPPPVDPFFFCSAEPARLETLLAALCDHARPDLVHIHHFTYWGVEIFDFFRARGIPTIFTAHEYLSICHHFGQMVKRPDYRLCREASPAECTRCFPEISSGMFFLRAEIIRTALAQAAAVVSPSRILRERLEAWSDGRLPVLTIENPRDPAAYEAPLRPADAAATKRADRVFGYFGQLNFFKGTDVLLDAFAILKARGADARLRIFGANLESQEEGFRERVREKIAALGDMVEFFGAYENRSVVRLMSDCDAVVIPSIWWENSPVVIQEAIQAGVPVVASRLGGIEEKLRPYAGAVLFETGSASDLAEKIAAVTSSPPRQPLRARRMSGSGVEDPWEQLVALYRKAVRSPGRGKKEDDQHRSDSEGAGTARRAPGRRNPVPAGGRRLPDQPHPALGAGR